VGERIPGEHGHGRWCSVFARICSDLTLVERLLEISENATVRVSATEC
jgi:hypothetical protein